MCYDLHISTNTKPFMLGLLELHQLQKIENNFKCIVEGDQKVR